MLNLSAIGKVIFMLVIIGVIFFYYGNKILQFLKAIFTKVNRKVYIIIYVVIVVLMIGGTASSITSMPTILKVILRNISSFIMGVFVYSLILFIITDIILMIGKILKLVHKPIVNKVYLISSLIVMGLTLCINI